jgi:hypothetical protein
MWSDPDLKPYMAVTAHWLEKAQTQDGQQKLTLRADLIGFLYFPGSHTGERLAEIFYFIITRMGLEKKVMSILSHKTSSANFFFKTDWLDNNR